MSDNFFYFCGALLFVVTIALWGSVSSMVIQGIPIDSGVGENIFHFAITGTISQAIYLILIFITKR